MSNITSNELLAKIHKVSLYILLAFDKVCRENNLTYFIDSGTALGAIRHGGFIPWDDDIDVGMPRKDYERFLQIGRTVLPDEFFIQTHETDPSYKRNAAKLRLKGTIFQEFDDLPFKENGLFIDIFPFDNIPANKYVAKFNIVVLGMMYHVIYSWWNPKKSTSKFRAIIRKCIKMIPESLIECANETYIKYCKKYENIDTGYMTCHYWGMTYSKLNTYIFDTKKLLPVKDIPFEKHSVKIMQDADYYLKIIYGDYMTLPPEAARHGHHYWGRIDFGGYV